MKSFLFALLLFSSLASAQQESKTVNKAGALYFYPFYSMNESRFTNTDGRLVKFEGDGFGLRLGFRPFAVWLPGLSLTAEYASETAENENDSSEELKSTSISYGLTQYMNRFFYFSGRVGKKTIEIENGSIESELKPEFVNVGIGLDLLQVGDSFSFTLEALYSKGFSEKTKNTNAAYNAGFDGIEYRVGIRWSPSVSFTLPGK